VVVGRRERTGDYFHSSPTRRRVERMVSSSRYKPAARNALSRSPAEGITPRCLARSTTPSVPMSGMSKALAQARAEASSSTAVQWARSKATPKTAVSPGPSPHSTSSEGMRRQWTRTPQPPSRACRAASEPGSGLDLHGHRHRQQELAWQLLQELEVAHPGEHDHWRRVDNPDFIHARLPR
jgi:hypothetical protein